MKVYVICLVMVGMVCGQRVTNRKKSVVTPSTITTTTTTTAAPDALPNPQTPPELDWGKCPQLAPTRAEELRKDELTERCFKQHPVPTELTERRIKVHSKQIMDCALKADNWFDKRGRYRFSRALARISGKKLPKDIESELKEHLSQCRSEAEKKFPKKANVIDLVQLFQACMNFHTTTVCEITLKNNANN